MKNFCLAVLTIFIASCNETENTDSSSSVTSTCKGVYEIKDSNGLVRQRYNEYQNSMGCLTDPVPLTQWEKSVNVRFDKKVSCTPQTDLPSMWIKSSGNYYSYRDSKIFIELNASTGEAKRLILAEMPDGSLSFQRQVFCYYLRTDMETEPVNPQNYGQLLQFDLELSASSNIFSPQELYSYKLSGNDFLLQKLDDNTGLTWEWCPTSTPVGFCDYNRNGNEMFFPPAPSSTIQAQLRSAAILIRSELNMTNISSQEFKTTWDNSVKTGVEVGTPNYIKAGSKWKYSVNFIWDEPLYIGRSVRNYMRRDPMQPFMPDLAWASSFQFPYVCYSTRKEVTYSDGSKGFINGQACYDSNGVYTFN